ncbi:hypothetical protein D3C76_1581860 [compost metagenome]
MFAWNVQHQAMATGFAMARVMNTRRDHHQLLANNMCIASLDFKFEVTSNAEDKLRMIVAVSQFRFAVMAKVQCGVGDHR